MKQYTLLFQGHSVTTTLLAIITLSEGLKKLKISHAIWDSMNKYDEWLCKADEDRIKTAEAIRDFITPNPDLIIG